jgi:hypothetical protein
MRRALDMVPQASNGAAHRIRMEPGSLLRRLLGQEPMANSLRRRRHGFST